MPDGSPKKSSRIQQRNRYRILDAALDVFSVYGYRGATLDQIAAAAGLSKPNILYYFAGKEEIHLTLLSQLMETSRNGGIDESAWNPKIGGTHVQVRNDCF